MSLDLTVRHFLPSTSAAMRLHADNEGRRDGKGGREREREREIEEEEGERERTGEKGEMIRALGHSLMHMVPHSLIYFLIHSLIHLLLYSTIDSLTHSSFLTLILYFTWSNLPPLMSFIHCNYYCPLVHSVR